MHNRTLRIAGAIGAALATLLVVASPAGAESIDVTIGECENDGTRQMVFEVDSVSEQVQWIVDGSNFFGGPTEADAQTIFVRGDDNTHTIQAVTVPGGDVIESLQISIPSCGTATAGQTTTVAPTTTAAPADEDTTTSERTADLFPAWVAGIPDDDPDGGLVVRSGPSTGDNNTGVLANGTGVIALDDPASTDWVEIISPVNGWVSTRYLSKESPASETTAAPTTTAAPSTTEAPETTASGAADPDDVPEIDTDGEIAEPPVDSSTSIPDALAATADEAPVTGDSSADSDGLPTGLMFGGLGLLAIAGAALFALKSRNSDEDSSGSTPAAATAQAKTTEPPFEPSVAADIPRAVTAPAAGAATALLNAGTPTVTTTAPQPITAKLPEPSVSPITPATPKRGSTKPARRKTAPTPDEAPKSDPAEATKAGGESWDPSKLAAAVAAAKERPEPESGAPRPERRASRAEPADAPRAAMSQRQRDAARRLIDGDDSTA